MNQLLLPVDRTDLPNGRTNRGPGRGRMDGTDKHTAAPMCVITVSGGNKADSAAAAAVSALPSGEERPKE